MRAAWKDHGRTPAEVFEAMTPTQFIAVFFKATGATGSVDRLEELTRFNRERGKRGLKPIIPSWLA